MVSSHKSSCVMTPYVKPLMLMLMGLPFECHATEFSQDFSKVDSPEALRGSGDGQFEYVGKAGEAAQLSIVDSAFQVDVTYNAESSDLQNSGVRLTRLSPLAGDSRFLMVHCRLELLPKLWPRPKQSLFNIAVGENFRGSPFNPARESVAKEGPTFASVMLSAGINTESFYFFSGQKEKSEVFQVAAEAGGRLVLPLAFAFNSGTTAVEVKSPSGSVSVGPGTFSVWYGEELVWKDVPSPHPETLLNNFSFGLGRGTDATAEQGATSEGTFRLSDIQITTEPR